MNDKRLKKAARTFWDSLERSRWEHGTLGRKNSDGSYTIYDETRPGFVHVRMDSGTMTIARDVGKVPLRATLPVRLRREAGVLVLDSEDTSGLLEGDTGEPSNPYGVPAHPISIHTDVDITTPTTGEALVYDGTNWVNDTILADVAAAIEAAADKTTPVDADDFGITDSAAANVLKKLSFANLATWVMSKITALTGKTTPVGGDSFVITDSEASDVPKRLTLTNFGIYLATSLNLLYGRLAVANTWLANNAFNSIATSGSALSVTRNLTATSTDAPVVSIVQDHASDDQAALRVQQDGSGSIAEFYNGATLKAQIKNSGAVVDVKGAARYAGTGTAPSADGTGQALELWYWTGAGGPYGLLLAYDRDAATYKPVRIAGDSIGFEEGATRIMTIDDGFVGIGVNPAIVPFQVRVGTNQNLGVALSTDTTITAFNDAGSANVPLRILASILKFKAGTGTALMAAGGLLNASVTTAGNVGAGEDDIYTYVVPANTLAVNGQSLWFWAYGFFANNANSKQVRVRFGTGGTNQVITSGASTGFANGPWFIKGKIFRTGAATQVSFAEVGADNVSNGYINATQDQTLSGAVTFRITGEGVNNNDVTVIAAQVGFGDMP